MTATLGLRAKRFELALWDMMEERMLAKLASLDLGRLLDPSFIELHRLARVRGTGAILRLWQSERTLVGAAVALGMGSLVLLGLDPIIGVLALFHRRADGRAGLAHRSAAARTRRGRDAHLAQEIRGRVRAHFAARGIAFPPVEACRRLSRLLSRIGRRGQRQRAETRPLQSPMEFGRRAGGGRDAGDPLRLLRLRTRGGQVHLPADRRDRGEPRRSSYRASTVSAPRSRSWSTSIWITAT